ncbi:MAG TPA: hypothetical protein VHL11_03035, partial [Phototrophicaceae bacterium]|nr:hypothetical protein [Phototrophicaceae bacterium]
MKLIVLITAQIENGLSVAQAWQDAGAPGVTILRSYGLYTLQQQAQHGGIELPHMIASMAGIMAAMIDDTEENSEIILTLAEDQLIETLISAANKMLGNLEEPDQGILFVVNVE